MKKSESKNRRIAGRFILITILAVWGLKSCWIESYRTQSDQMEGALFDNENIFVNKWSYGLRLIQTPLGIPFLHDSINAFHIPAYIAGWQLPYIRLAYHCPQQNDIIVFNHPRPLSPSTPVDRRPVCLSRCVGLPGDTIELQNGVLRINGKRSTQSPQSIYPYLYSDTAARQVNAAMMLTGTVKHSEPMANQHLCFLSQYECMKLNTRLKDNLLHPVHLKQNNFRMILPTRQTAIQITPENIDLLFPLIVNHENQSARKQNNKLYINDKPVRFFLFKQDYYWMLSDNRTAGVDSRKFGAVPHSHLIGKGSFIWLSRDPDKPLMRKIRMNRLFTSVE